MRFVPGTAIMGLHVLHGEHSVSEFRPNVSATLQPSVMARQPLFPVGEGSGAIGKDFCAHGAVVVMHLHFRMRAHPLFHGLDEPGGGEHGAAALAPDERVPADDVISYGYRPDAADIIDDSGRRYVQ